MIKLLLSPAKTLDYNTSIPVDVKPSMPRHLDHSTKLINILKHYTVPELMKLMSLSEALSTLNIDRYNEWSTSHIEDKHCKQAIYTFDGDVYRGLDAYTLTQNQIEYAQHNLRFLSGLYGMLRPHDLIQPHRLEMGTSLINDQGKNIVSFWKELVTKQLVDDLNADGDTVVVNCASKEYFNVIGRLPQHIKVITPVFKQEKNGQFKVIAIHAKRARGLMARYVCQTQPNDVTDLQSFDLDGYVFDKSQSTDDTYVFLKS
jgi:uncharacterized protein